MYRHARRTCRRTVASLLGACLAMLGASAGAAHAAGWTTANQHQLVPAYFYPDWWSSSSSWYRMCDALNVVGGASTVVMNPNSGPGTAANPDYQRVIDYCHARGQQVISYVHTSYGGRTAAAVKAEIDSSYAFYPGIDGIFLDEMSNAPTTRAYYQYLYAAIKAKAGVRDVVGNPGAAASTSWQLDTPVADEVVVFEGPAANYQRWTAPPWTAAKPASRLVHLVYAAAPASAMQQTCMRSKRLNAGLVYVTNDNLPNPWDTLPAADYWASEIAAC